ncbi:hypothetical protein ASG66_12970 [Bacillus sp. Leaf406]|nr:hypothetical protein ASG66_12970 [Bacillus sp. Leaf406]
MSPQGEPLPLFFMSSSRGLRLEVISQELQKGTGRLSGFLVLCLSSQGEPLPLFLYTHSFFWGSYGKMMKGGLSVSVYVWVLSFLCVGLAGYALYYTFRVTGQTKSGKDNGFDSDVQESVKAHPILLNPVFVTIAIATVLITAFIVYQIILYYG